MRKHDKGVLNTDLPLSNRRQGKVRDIYDIVLPDGTVAVLIVATDRVSVFDVNLGSAVPGKGIILTRISEFWFDFLEDISPNHMLSTNAYDIPGISKTERDMLCGRVMICRKARVIPIECVVRGYLTGGGYKEYLSKGSVSGVSIPDNLVNGHKFSDPMFTPSTKVDEGHDENISFDQASAKVGRSLMERMRDLSVRSYEKARDYAQTRGIIIADTKFEFGLDERENLILIDEVLTPDSSRFWDAEAWSTNKKQDNFDKQFLRDYAENLFNAGLWDKTSPGPEIPGDIAAETLKRYEDLEKRII